MLDDTDNHVKEAFGIIEGTTNAKLEGPCVMRSNIIDCICRKMKAQRSAMTKPVKVNAIAYA
jgi:hypothetical protein